MNVTRDEARKVRREEAEARNKAWASKSLDEQIAHLDSLFGEGKGAMKQRIKIARQKVDAATKAKNNTKKSSKEKAK